MELAVDHFSFFVLRLPRRPISQLIEQINSVIHPSSTDESKLLLKLLQQPGVDESIYLASPDLYTAWQSAKVNPNGLDDALKKALWRYVIRSYSRATPYGLFAGVGVGTIGPSSRAMFGPTTWKTVSRPDSLALLTISRRADEDLSIRLLLHYRLNNSLYETAEQYRFSERTGSHHQPKIVLSSLPHTPDLQTLVNFLRVRGSASYAELITLYGPEYQQQVKIYVNQLIYDQFLISNLALPVTGSSAADYLLKQLKTLGTEYPLYQQLSKASSLLRDSPIKLTNLKHVQKLFHELVHDKTDDRTDALVQTDLFFYPTQLELSSTTIKQIAKQFSQLLTVLQHRSVSPLEDFSRRFRERFDKQEVDLLTALDPDFGIGFMQDTLAGFPLLSELFDTPPSSPHVKQEHLQPLRDSLYSRHVLSKSKEVEITEADLAIIGLKITNATSLPPSWYLHGELFFKQQTSDPAFSSITDDKPDTWMFVLNSTICGSAAYFLGRFCQGHEQLRAHVQAMCAWEQTQYPADILAEIVHLPVKPVRAGNVVARPVLRSVEIPYLTPAGVSDDHTILLSDLVVSVSDGGEVILRHKKTGRRVRPRHSNAHNSGLGDEVYQFLSAIQANESPILAWSWGALHHLPFLPRVVFKNLIVSPAQWVIQKQSLPLNHTVSAESLRHLYELPRYVQLIEGDNKLLLDLEFGPTSQMLVDAVKKQERVFLKEWIGQTFQPWIKDGLDQYVSELVIPLKSPSVQKNTWRIVRPTTSFIQRTFLPGQEWFYIKVYLNESAADLFLSTILSPLNHRVKKNGWATTMFFVRYADPNYHLRIRFLTSSKQYGRLVNAWQKAIQDYSSTGLVERVQLDTYQRELERYQPELIDCCEAIFSADSQSFLAWLVQNEAASEEERYALAVRSVDALLVDFTFTLDQKLRICQQLQQAFFKEHGGEKELKHKLNDRYRKSHKAIFDQSARYIELMEERKDRMRVAIDRIQNFFSTVDTHSTYYSLIGSIIHITLNRIFPSHQRKHELVVYHFLARYYESQKARIQP